MLHETPRPWDSWTASSCRPRSDWSFVFATVAGLVSVIAESISRHVGLRAEFLLRGLRTLVDSGGTFKIPFWEAVKGRVLGNERKATATTPPISAATAAR